MKKFLSLVLCLLLSLSFIPYVATLNVNAASYEQISENQTWHKSWDGSAKYVYLTVSQTGYYNLSITDFAAEAGVRFNISDMEFDSENYSWYNTQYGFNDYIETYDRENLYLVKDHFYQIELAYGDYDEYDNFVNFYADLSITFTKTDYTPIKLTLNSNKQLGVGYNTYDWLEFKTTVAGDYLFTLNDYANFNLDIYEKVSGDFVKFTYFDYCKTTCLKLKANTEYIIKTSSGEKSEKLVRLNISKASANISKIDIIQNHTILADEGYIYDDWKELYYSDYSDFEYKITLSNGTTQTLSHDGLRENGIIINSVEYTGDIYSYGDERFFKPGKQSVIINYMNNQTCTSHVTISTYLSWCSNLNAKSDFEDMLIEYENDDIQTYYWRIKPDENNAYDFYSRDWDELGYLNITIFDKNNTIVPGNYGVWGLKAGQEYVVRISYSYDDYCYNDVLFWLEPDRDHTHSYKNSCDADCDECGTTRKVTHSYKTTTTKATTSKNGSIVKKCTVCGKSTTTTINYAKTFTLSTTSYTYNGAVKTPTVTVKDSAGKVLKKDVDYKVTYPSGRKSVGTYKVTVTMIGNYSGTKTLSFKINPQSVSNCKISLSATSYTYNGAVKTPTVTVKNASGTKLTNGTHYTVTYSSGRKNVGTYKVTIKMKGNYSGTKTLTFKINPVKTTISKLTAGKKSITIAITKKSTQVTGYQIQYSTSKTFSKATTKTISSYKTTKYMLKSLSAKKTYYVRVRTYKTVNGTKYYSGWSTYKYTKTK